MAGQGDPIFTVEQTHGILRRPEHRIEASSDGLGWSSLFASVQHEQPYADRFAATVDHLIIVHRDGPVRIERELYGERINRMVQPGGLFILPARRDFAVGVGAGLSTIHLYVRARLIAEAAAELAAGDPAGIELVPRLGEHDQLIEQTAYAAAEMVRENIRGDWFAESLARTLAGQLVRRHSTARMLAPRPVAGLSTRRLKAVADFVEAHLGEPVSLSDMAGAVALSPIHFAREFKRATGRSPHQYLLATRVDAAKRLLRTDRSIAEIAFCCGFSHQEHLTRMFSRITGFAPAAYRRTLRS